VEHQRLAGLASTAWQVVMREWSGYTCDLEASSLDTDTPSCHDVVSAAAKTSLGGTPVMPLEQPWFSPLHERRAGGRCLKRGGQREHWSMGDQRMAASHINFLARRLFTRHGSPPPVVAHLSKDKHARHDEAMRPGRALVEAPKRCLAKLVSSRHPHGLCASALGQAALTWDRWA
jgi:hypothetical protein